MVLAGVFRLRTFMTDHFPGEAGQRTVPPMGASIAPTGSPGNPITKNRFSQGRSLSRQISELRPLVCRTQGITPRPWISGLAHLGGIARSL